MITACREMPCALQWSKEFDDIAGGKRRNKKLLDMHFEDDSVHRSIKNEGRDPARQIGGSYFNACAVYLQDRPHLRCRLSMALRLLETAFSS